MRTVYSSLCVLLLGVALMMMGAPLPAAAQNMSMNGTGNMSMTTMGPMTPAPGGPGMTMPGGMLTSTMDGAGSCLQSKNVGALLFIAGITAAITSQAGKIFLR